MFKTKRIAITEIILLLIGIFAFSWMIGSSIEVVSAGGLPKLGESCGAGGICINTTTTNCNGEKKIGLCDPDEIRCCVPVEEPEENKVNPQNAFSWIVTGTTAANGLKKISTMGTPLKKAAAKEVGTEVAKEGFETVTEGYASTIPQLGEGSSTAASSTTSSGTSAATSTATGAGSKILLGGSTIIGHIAAGLIWSAIAFVIGRYVIGPLFGLSVQNAQALGYALASGTAAAFIAADIIGVSALSGPGVIIGIVVAAIVFLSTAKRSSTDTVIYNCYTWEADLGGKNCEECNLQEIPCTEYQCHSLGQGCELITDEDSGQKLCVWENPNDVLSPVISAWEDALPEDGSYFYTPDDALSPPDKGVKLLYTGSEDGCAPAWTPVEFGIELNERAKCKFSVETIYDNYEEMPNLYFSGGARLYNHSYKLSLPTTAALASDNITVENNGIYRLYVRCEDANGNANTANFGVKFCIDDGPDTTPPIIRNTIPLDKTPFAVGQTEFDISVFVNEPSECKWSWDDKSYELMENEMDCDLDVSQINSQNLYECSTILTGLKNNQENDFYFRCKDQPWLEDSGESAQRNVNSESYHYTLIGTEELVIKSVSPNNEIIKDSTSPVEVTFEVETSLGYDDGKAICSFSETGEEGSYIEFFYEYKTERYSQYKHSQTFYLGAGNHTYYIRCNDLANNIDEEIISFNVETDLQSPLVIRVFKEEERLKIITDEKAECVYSTFGCEYYFDVDGTPIITFSGGADTEHYTDWNINQNYYIKCQDEFGNRPPSNECSIVVRPFEVPELRNS